VQPVTLSELLLREAGRTMPRNETKGTARMSEAEILSSVNQKSNKSGAILRTI
jgi:hypothetical protein